MSGKTDKISRLSRRQFLKSAAAASAGLALAQAPLMRLAAQGSATNLEFWDMVWGPTEFIETAGRLVDQFNASQSAINVTYQSTPWSNWYQTFLTAIGSGTAPDLSTGAGYQAAQFTDFGAIEPVDDVIDQMKQDGTFDDFLPGLVDRLVYQDHHIALPWAIDIRVLYYRKDLLEAAGVEPPTTWDEFRAAAKALTKGEQFGLVIPASGTPLAMHTLLSFIFNNGGGFFAEDGSLDVMNERNLEAVQFLAGLVADGSVHPGSAGFAESDADKAFSQGNVAMYLRNPGFESREDMVEIKDNIGLLSPLESSHGTKGTIFWINNVMIYTQTEDAAATKTFLKWYSENQLPLWTEGHVGQLPVRSSFAADPYFQDNAFTKKILDEWVPVGQTTGAHLNSTFPALNELEGEGVLTTLIQDILLGKDPVEALQNAAPRITSIVEG